MFSLWNLWAGKALHGTHILMAEHGRVSAVGGQGEGSPAPRSEPAVCTSMVGSGCTGVYTSVRLRGSSAHVCTRVCACRRQVQRETPDCGPGTGSHR